jgi:fatty-acyl-CoA synthase
LGYFKEGHLHFVSRLDDVINVAGLNVYPQDVEEVVLEIPTVTDAVVFAGKHGFDSEQVSLQFVSTTELSKQEVRQWCGERLARYQIPLSIIQVDFIPKLPNGKVSRRALSERIAEPSFSQTLPGASV